MREQFERALCRWGLHQWRYRDIWEPSITAKIVTRWRQERTCARCARRQLLTDQHFDPLTGQRIEPPRTITPEGLI